MTALWVAAGGAVGAAARYGLGSWIQRTVGGAFPWGTAFVNVVGSLLIGFLLVALRASASSIELRLFLMVGVLGGFTTFSTFSLESVVLIQEGRWGSAAAYALGSLVLGIVAVLLGIAAADALVGK